MVRPDVRAAIDSARTVASDGGRSGRYRSYDDVRAIALAVAQELPSDMTLGELVDELQISENQAEHRTRSSR